MLASAPIPGELLITAFRILYQLDLKQARRKAQVAQYESDSLSLSELTDEHKGARSVHSLVARTVRFSERDSQRMEIFKMLAVGAVTEALLESGLGQKIPELSVSSLVKKDGTTKQTELAEELVEEVTRVQARGGRRKSEHLELLATHGRELVREVSRMDEIWLLKLVAITDLEIGAYQAAIDEYTRLWLLFEALAGEQDEQTIVAIMELAKAMQKAGSRYAGEFAEKAVKAASESLGDDNGITLEARATLSTSLKQGGELDAALELDEKILEARRRLLGPDDPSTVITADNLAYTLHALALQRQDVELLNRAAKLHEENCQAFIRILGPEDPRTLTAKNNLAGALVDQGKFAEANGILEEVYETRRRVLGEKHPDTITALVSLARNTHYLGDERGFRWLERAVDLAREVLGSRHPHTLVAVCVLANWLRSRNELDTARRLGEEVLQARRRIFGEGHERTIEAMNELVETLRALGDQKAERALLGELVSARQSVLGIDHPDTLSTMRTLAASYYDAGDYENSARVEKNIHEALLQSRGETDPTTLVALSDLASSHFALGNLDEAERMTRRIVNLRAQALGYNHPDTIEARYNLFGILYKAGKQENATKLIIEVKENLATMKQAAIEKFEKGEHSQARVQLESLVHLCRRIMGETEDTTLDAIGSLAGMLLRVGKHRDALHWIQNLLETSKKLHGENHPNTIAFQNIYAQTLGQLAKEGDSNESS